MNDYRRLVRALERAPLPAVVVDLDAIDTNTDTLMAPVIRASKTLRAATKSIRCVDLIRHIRARGGDRMQGLMSYAVREAAFLVDHGFDDIFVAYPSVDHTDLSRLAALNRDGHTVSIAADDTAQIDAIERVARGYGAEVPVVIDVDMSLRLLADRLHVGVRRSPINSAEDVVKLAQRIRGHHHLRLHGLMGYEAQIAGVTDKNPFSPGLNAAKRAMKQLSRRRVQTVRKQVVDALRADGHNLAFVNGGGSGSIHWTTEEEAVTEVTAGSGFIDSHLFDYYQDLDLRPAVFFAVQVVRRPAPGIVTCHGGGYIASGEAGRDRLPRPWWPRGLELLDLEGAGEVQTPLAVPSHVELDIGDPVFFRHAKAGELAEHFNTYLFVRGDRIVHRAPTYRGEGAAFL